MKLTVGKSSPSNFILAPSAGFCLKCGLDYYIITDNLYKGNWIVTVANEELSKDARMWAMFCHLAGLASYVVPVVISGIIAPLIIWQIKKDEFEFVDEHGKEAVNFQISMLLYTIICIPFCFICIGVFLLVAVGIVDIVFLLIAAIKANNGEHYRYPICIRFIK